MQEFSDKDIFSFTRWIKQQWGIDFHSTCDTVNVQGSPERTLSRMVIRDNRGQRFLIEKFSVDKFALRDRVARSIEYLHQKGLTRALPYKRSSHGQFLPKFNTGCFQVSDFLDSTQICRPEYLESADMGQNFARFLIDLSRASANIQDNFVFSVFSIKTYIYQLFNKMKQHNPVEHQRFMPVLQFLERSFMQAHDRLALAFCHGDLHPMNVIWDNDTIVAVIDWEFAGIKPDIYDLANLVGCAGIENPNGLGMPMVMNLVEQVRSAQIFSDAGWAVFPEYLLALRFAWLSEWLRNKDDQMLDMEYAYMKILMDHMDEIRDGWNI